MSWAVLLFDFAGARRFGVAACVLDPGALYFSTSLSSVVGGKTRLHAGYVYYRWWFVLSDHSAL